VTSCRVCAGDAVHTHDGKLLGHLDVSYFRCPACEYWFTEDPYWLEEAYSHKISSNDEGLVQRNITIARQLGVLLPRLYPNGPYVDWAGGVGLLVRLMRDAGFDYYWDDAFAENLLADGFTWADNSGRLAGPATFVSAIEVLEHVPRPVEFFNDVFEKTGTKALFFTECLHDNTFDPNWWYLLPDSGQHISFFSAKTLRTIADALGVILVSQGDSHLFSKDPIDQKRFSRAMRTSRTITYLTRTPARLSGAPSSLAWLGRNARSSSLHLR
jgi:hypothetical protein